MASQLTAFVAELKQQQSFDNRTQSNLELHIIFDNPASAYSINNLAYASDDLSVSSPRGAGRRKGFCRWHSASDVEKLPSPPARRREALLQHPRRRFTAPVLPQRSIDDGEEPAVVSSSSSSSSDDDDQCCRRRSP